MSAVVIISNGDWILLRYSKYCCFRQICFIGTTYFRINVVSVCIFTVTTCSCSINAILGYTVFYLNFLTYTNKQFLALQDGNYKQRSVISAKT